MPTKERKPWPTVGELSDFERARYVGYTSFFRQRYCENCKRAIPREFTICSRACYEAVVKQKEQKR